MDNKLGYIGIDQRGYHYHIEKHPRKELLEQLYSKHADKMYVDNVKTGEARHCGYVIAQRWITVYEIHEWNNI